MSLRITAAREHVLVGDGGWGDRGGDEGLTMHKFCVLFRWNAHNAASNKFFHPIRAKLR